MLADIVVDTNVLMHAENNQEVRQEESRSLLLRLKGSATHLCVDEGFHMDPARNKSTIGHEYQKHVRFGSLASAVIIHLAQSQRVKQVKRGAPPNAAKHIRSQVPKGPDRTYIQVAYNSADKVLACHDFNDIPETVRARLKKSIQVNVLDAGEALVLL